ncbi:MAG TPA: response regulator [Terriglobia bacterium]|nr:response regulator [Terriglobia bacterium]
MKKISVLIIDDSSVMRKIIERSLRQAGLELEKVIEADNGADALTMVEANAIDLIFSDVNMPKMDGLEFLRQIQGIEKAKGIPILMITTDGSEQKVVEAITLGAKGYIRKPFSADQVRAQVAQLLPQ